MVRMQRTSKRLAASLSAASIAIVAGQTAFAQSSAFTLYGTVRDFTAAHPDFGLPDTAAANHVAGNVDLVTASDGDPALNAAGRVVSAQYFEKAANEIAPHMFNFVGESAVRLVDPPSTNNNPTLDTYDPALGPYGGPNTGPMPNIVSGITMSAPPAPPNVGVSLGDLTFAKNGSTLIDTDFRCNDFTMQNRHLVTIDGDVTLVIDGTLSIENNTDIEINPGSSLTLFLLGNVFIGQHMHMNFNTADHTALTIHYLGVTPFEMHNNTHIYAQLYSYNAELSIENNADFYGAVEALGLSMVNGSGLHIAGPGGSSTCANISDTAGAMAGGHGGAIMGAATFDQWYTTIPGVNADTLIPMTFTKTAGMFEYSSFDFHPIDARLFGNEGEPFNRNFTLELVAKFNNSTCQGHFFEFTGSGDVWVFINEKLVIDLAGPQTTGHQYIDIDRLGLVDGQTYRLRFFYAQRTETVHPFEVRTNLDLINDLDGLAPVMSMAD